MWAGVRASHSEDTSEVSLIQLGSTTRLIKTISWKPLSKLENKRNRLEPRWPPPITEQRIHVCVQRVLILKPVDTNPFIPQGKWDFWQWRKVNTLSRMKWKYFKKPNQNKKRQPRKMTWIVHDYKGFYFLN